MSKIFKSIFIISYLVLITSCWTQDKLNDQNSWIEIKQIENKKIENKHTEQKVIYSKISQKLEIWDVIIKPWYSDLFPSEFKVINWYKTFINSNVPNYIFFITDKNTDKKSIVDFYDNMFKNLWFIKQENFLLKDDKKIENLNNLIYNKLNNDFIPKEKKTKEMYTKMEKEWKLRLADKEILNSFSININEEIPNNIKKYISDEWLFVEVYFN